MRHTHTTLLLKDGISLKVVANRDDGGAAAPTAAESEVIVLRATVSRLQEEIAHLGTSAAHDRWEQTGSKVADLGALGHPS